MNREPLRQPGVCSLAVLSSTAVSLSGRSKAAFALSAAPLPSFFLSAGTCVRQLRPIANPETRIAMAASVLGELELLLPISD